MYPSAGLGFQYQTFIYISIFSLIMSFFFLISVFYIQPPSSLIPIPCQTDHKSGLLHAFVLCLVTWSTLASTFRFSQKTNLDTSVHVKM